MKREEGGDDERRVGRRRWKGRKHGRPKEERKRGEGEARRFYRPSTCTQHYGAATSQNPRHCTCSRENARMHSAMALTPQCRSVECKLVENKGRKGERWGNDGEG